MGMGSSSQELADALLNLLHTGTGIDLNEKLKM